MEGAVASASSRTAGTYAPPRSCAYACMPDVVFDDALSMMKAVMLSLLSLEWCILRGWRADENGPFVLPSEVKPPRALRLPLTVQEEEAPAYGCTVGGRKTED